MSNPTAAQVLNRVAEYIDAAQRHYAACDAGKYDSELEHAYGCQRDELEDLDAAHLRTLAQAHADQQARLLALVARWGEEASGHVKEYLQERNLFALQAAQIKRECADELEAVLGGKE